MTITKDVSISFPTRSKGRNWNWNESSAWDNDTISVFTAPRWRTGTRLPKWSAIIDAGGNATTPMTAQFSSLDYRRMKLLHEEFMYQGVPSQFHRRENEGDLLISNNQNAVVWATHLNILNSTSYVDNLAKAAFLKKVKGLTTQFQGMIFLGELTETLRMLRKPLVGIRALSTDFLGTLRKRKRANPKKWANDIGSAWLEQSFGWNPLLNDVRDAVKAYEKLLFPLKTIKVSAGASKSYDNTKARPTPLWPGFVAQYNAGCYWLTVSSIQSENIKVRYKGAVISQAEGPRWQDEDLFGFEPQNFIPALWELLPWSFLADYFTNIGDILDGEIVDQRRLAWVNRSTITTAYKMGWFKQVDGPLPGGSWQRVTRTSGQGHHLYKQKNVMRSADVGFILPSLQFNFDLTQGQLANIGALFSQASALHPQHNPRNWHR